MYIPLVLTLAALSTILAHPTETDTNAALVPRTACNSDACITFFSDGGCTDGRELGSYRPDCTGNCFQYNSFSSIRIAANTFTGADCIAYSDDNCQNEIRDSGNKHDAFCLDNLGTAKSMQCFYGC